MTHLVIAMPCYGGMASGFTMQSCNSLPGYAAQSHVGLSYSFMFNESLIQRARNALAHGFLKNPEATHLMFIDADIKFDARDIFTMMAQDKDVICGLYPKKEINWAAVHHAATVDGVPADQLVRYTGSMVVNLPGLQSEMSVRADEPFEVEAAGTGFMLIKRATLEALAPSLPRYVNDVHDASGNLGAEEVIEFFPVHIEPVSRRLLSEDYAFCKLVRDAGMKVWAAPWVRLGHFGTYLFEGGLIPEQPPA